MAFKYTSIGRPLDPSYPTNKAVLVLMPVGGVIAATAALYAGVSLGEGAIAAIRSLLLVLGSWAVTREIAPDDNPAAFIAMACAFAASLVIGAPSLLLLFTALALSRIVNRSTGLPAKPLDSWVVTGLTIWAVFDLNSPILGVIGALAFAADAVLHDGRRSQLLFAFLCLAGGGFLGFRDGFLFELLGALSPAEVWLILAIAAGSLILALQAGAIESVGDVTGEPLSSTRVRTGLLLTLLLAAQAFIVSDIGLQESSAVWAALAGALIGRVWALIAS